MTAREKTLLREGQELLTRLIMKYDLIEKIPFEFGCERIPRAQLHMIEAIGKGYGATVTALADYFMITKGAVSQVVSKLCAKGFVAKSKGTSGGKEKPLRLTNKGRKAFDIHESYNELGPDILSCTKGYTDEEIRAFLDVLRGLDKWSGGYFAELAGNRGKRRPARLATVPKSESAGKN
jgi:DNA-binding MarR family transcriptional regulator